MWNRIKKLFSPPTFEDEEKTRVAAMANTIIIALILILSGMELTKLIIGYTLDKQLDSFIPSAIGIVSSLGLLVLLHRGQVRLASFLLALLVLVLPTLSALPAGGVDNSGIATYLVAIVMAGLLLGGKEALGFAGLSLLLMAGITYARSNGWVPVEGPEISPWVIYPAIFIMTALLLSMAQRSIRDSLNRARAKEQEAVESNRELQAIQETLEERISARTRGLETVAALSEQFTSILDLEHLLEELVNRVKEDFDYYYAHVYLMDEQRQSLVMTAGVGQAGAEMKAKGHSIPVDASTSLVARAARSGQVVNVEDVQEVEDWLLNPLLPDTQCEMAVPIIKDEEVVGVLDVQDDKIGGLAEDDAGLLRSLAGHVAVALSNARLFEEVQGNLQTIQAQQQTIQDISTPVIPVLDQIIVLPLVGVIDSLRARDVTRSLLAGINRHKARIVILDVTGVSLMDTGIVNHLNKTIQAAQLKGAKTIVTGISDAVAEAIVDLGIDWNNVETLNNLQTGLVTALNNMGYQLTRSA